MGLFDKFKKKENNNVSNEEKNNINIDIEQAKKDKQFFIYNHEVSIKKIKEINEIHNINLDYSLHSISILMELISNYQIKYKNKDFDDNYLTNLFTILGIYLGDTLLKNGIAEKGGTWCVPSEIPNSNIVLGGNSGNAVLVIINDEKATIIKPIDKIKQYWENGNEDNLLVFCKGMLELNGIKHDINNVNNGTIIISQIENQ